MSMNLIDINHIPVPTWRWLKINSSKISLPLDSEIQEYKKGKWSGLQQKGLQVRDIYDCTDLKGEDFLSQEVFRQASEHANIRKSLIIGKEESLKEPVIMEIEGDSKNRNMISNISLRAEENSRGEIILRVQDEEEIENFFSTSLKVKAQKGSQVDIVIIQNTGDRSTSLASLVVDVEEDAKVNITSVEFGGKDAHTKILSNIMDGGECTLGSVYLRDGQQKLDVNYIMNHIGKRCSSDIKAFGALSGEAKKVFKGTIDFKKGAVESKGTEEEYVMLLSPKARNLSAPLLLCSEDDVQGEHAASSGNIDENKMFYLTSRGLDPQQAKRVMITSLFNPVIDRISKEDIREEIHHIIESRIMREGERNDG